MKRPRIGIDCQKILTPDGGGAGVEHYVYHLVLNIAKAERDFDLVLFLHPSLQDSPTAKTLAELGQVEVVFYPLEVIERQSWWPYTKYKRLSQFLASHQLDLFHGPANVTPLYYQGRTVITTHDLIIFEHPEWFPGGLADWFWRKVLIPKALRHASRHIAVSEFTKQQLVSIFDVKADLIDVVFEGITTGLDASPNSQILDKFKIKTPYLLYVGTVEPRKNLVRLIEAFSRIAKDHPELQLVLAGKYGWKYEPIKAAAKNSDAASRIIFTDYIDEPDKHALYQKALAFTFPSLAEGFGLPPLDAMLHSVPVLTSDITSLPEVVGDAALLVKPTSVDSLTNGLRRMVEEKDLREKLITRGREQVKKFSWDKAARETMAVYRRALSND